MVYAQPRIRPWKWDAQNSLGFWDKNGSSNLGQTINLVIVRKKIKRTCRTADFDVCADHRVKIKENKKKDKYQDYARELK